MSSLSCCCCFSFFRSRERQALVPLAASLLEDGGIKIAPPPDLISRESFVVQPLNGRHYLEWNGGMHQKVFSCLRILLTFASEKRQEACIIGRQTEREGFFYDVVVNPSTDLITLLANALLGGVLQSVEEQKAVTLKYRDKFHQVRVSEYTEIPVNRYSVYDSSTCVVRNQDIEVHIPTRALSQYHFVIASPIKALPDLSEELFVQMEQISQMIIKRFRSIWPRKETLMFYDSHGDKHLLLVDLPTGWFQKRKMIKYLSAPPKDPNPQATAYEIQNLFA